MTDEDFKRKLAAILSADVEGYSRLMDDDEEATVRTLKACRAAINDLAQQYRGRIVDSPGDNILAEFTSVVDAVNCAVEIQRDLAERNTELAYGRQMQFRIGVNLGDVIEDDGNIYGDGVNIAARVESLAEAGGICISGRAYDQVLNKLGLEYENLGEHQVKNIGVPIRVYRVLSHPGAAAHRVVQAKESLGRKWRKIAISAVVLIAIVGGLAYWQFYMRRPTVEPASIEKMAFPLPEKPSIAVLPFANMSEDPKQEYLSDGITEQIISTLSKVPSMFVIARTSTFAYKNKPVKVQQVSQDLGVRYVLEGSVQRSGDRLRITAQLIDALDGKHMWAQRYDRELKDIFKLQDEITLKIINSLMVKLTEGEQYNLWSKNAPSNVEYMEKIFEAAFYVRQFNKESNHRAKQLCKEAIDLDPEYWMAYWVLASAHSLDVWMGSSSSPRESLGKAFELSKKAISLDEKQDRPHQVIGNIYLLMRKYDLAIEKCKQAIALNPNSAAGYVFLGQSLAYSGRPEEGIESIKKGMRLSPFPSNMSIQNLAIAYREAGRYEESIAEYKRALKLAPNSPSTYIGLSMTYALAGRFEQAREAYSEALKINPNYSLEKGLKTFPYRPGRIKVVRAAMQKAGLPFKPPLPLPDKPSIAVLAFDNLSGDPEQEYFSDGLAEDIITALSKTPKIFVIARNSTFTYKNKPVKVQEVGRDLGVRYVLEGSVRKAGTKVRITAQLVDAKTGHHLWAESYDRDQKDIFALQDDITKRIITELQVELTEGEQARLHSKGTDNLKAYLLTLEARKFFRRHNLDDNYKARQLLEDAIEIDSQYADLYYLLALTHYNESYWAPKSAKDSIRKAIELANKAISLNNSLSEAYSLLGSILIRKKQHETGLKKLEEAAELCPNGANVHALLAFGLAMADKTEEAILISKKAMRLNPIPPSWYLLHRTMMYRNIGNYNEALVWAEKTVKVEPKNFVGRLNLCSAYSLTGRMAEARIQANEAMKLNPKFSLKWFDKALPYKNISVKNRYIEALRKAGVPE